MRDEGGLKDIYAAVEKLKNRHHEHIAVYGEHNTLRLTGKHETAPITEFRAGMSLCSLSSFVLLAKYFIS